MSIGFARRGIGCRGNDSALRRRPTAGPARRTLAAMGLSDLRVMSDSEGLAVRGLGWSGSSAYGQSFAVVSTKGAVAGSTNGYKSSGKKVAGGANFSFAAVEVSKGGHGGDCYDDCGHRPKTGQSEGHRRRQLDRLPQVKQRLPQVDLPSKS